MGAWVYHTYNHFSELTTANLTLIPAAIVISVGVFLFIIGCLGCIAACKENKCLLAIVSKEKDASFSVDISQRRLLKWVHLSVSLSIDAVSGYLMNTTPLAVLF